MHTVCLFVCLFTHHLSSIAHDECYSLKSVGGWWVEGGESEYMDKANLVKHSQGRIEGHNVKSTKSSRTLSISLSLSHPSFCWLQKKGNSSKVELHLILITYIAWFWVIPKVRNPPHTHTHAHTHTCTRSATTHIKGGVIITSVVQFLIL